MAPDFNLVAYLTLFLHLCSSTPSFPVLPTQFRTKILGQFHLSDSSTGSFTIEQSFLRSLSDDSTIEKCLFTAEQYYKGTIINSAKNKTLEFNFSTCYLKSRKKDIGYQSYGISEKDNLGFQLVDVLQLFQNTSEVSAVNITEEGTVYSHAPSETVPFKISAHVLTDPAKLEKVVIKGENWNVTLVYDQLLPLTDTFYVSTPPHGVLCRSQGEKKALPPLDPFTSFEVRIISQYYTSHNSAEAIQLMDDKTENLTSIGFIADTDQPTHYTTVVHNTHSGNGWVVNRETEVCQQSSLLPTGSSFANSTMANELFVKKVLKRLHFYDRNYLALFWQVWVLLRDRRVSWQYQGTRLINSIHVQVWSYPVQSSWIAEVAFTVERITLRENGYTNTLRSIPVNIDLYRVHARSNAGPALSFPINNFQIDSSSATVAMAFDTSSCYSDSEFTVAQFTLDINYTVVYKYGVGNVKQAVVQSLIRWLNIERDQLSGVRLSPVPGRTFVTLTVYHGLHRRKEPSVVEEKLRSAVDAPLYTTFTNPNSDHVQLAYSVPGSLIINFQNNSPTHEWSVSITAAVSASLTTLFLGLLLGALVHRTWNNRSSRTVLTLGGEGRRCSPNYKKFSNEEDAVNIGSSI